MGQIIKDLQEIPDGYDNYLIILPSQLENETQRIIDSEFIRLSKAVGRNILIVYLYGDKETQRIIDKLQLQGDRFPMLLYLDKKPTGEESLTDSDGCIPFELGKLRDRYSLFLFLEKICWWVKSPHAKKEIEWIKKKENLLKILKPITKSIPYIGGTIEGFLSEI